MKLFKRKKKQTTSPALTTPTEGSSNSKEEESQKERVLHKEGEHSHIGNAVLRELEANQQEYHEELWSSTSGKVVGKIQHGPRNAWTDEEDPPEGHSDWLPEVYADLLAKTEYWCDFMSLSPPDGKFMEMIKEAIVTLAKKSIANSRKIVVRFMFGNIIATPVDCTAVMNEFTAELVKRGLVENSNLEMWVGAWRRDMSWNHAKIVAVDGKHVHTGGHNLWDNVYLEKDPIHDTSIHLEGPVAIQGHLFANEHWSYVKKNQSSFFGFIIDKVNDGLGLPIRTRVTISEYPEKKATTFAPMFHRDVLPSMEDEGSSDTVKMLSLGRYGKMSEAGNGRSSDDAFLTMFSTATSSIRLLLQDLGPVNATVAGIKIVYKSWPKHYFKVWSVAMFERDVKVDIVLSNPTAGEERGNYSNSWSCEEVAAEIIKVMMEEYPDASHEEIKKKIVENLRICFLCNRNGHEWKSNSKVGLHSKFFIVDDVCTYVGSQNLYEFDLAEWGVAIDDKLATKEIRRDLWDPMWACTFKDDLDIDAQKVMELLDIDREPNGTISDKELAKLEADINLDTLCERSKLHINGDS